MKKPIAKLKKDAWKLCSEYNRRKDANWDGNTSCVTCNKVTHWKQLQAGHFVPSRCNAILFDDRGIHAQCWQCNCGKNGQWVEYEAFMLSKYGQKVIDEIKRNKTLTKKFTAEELLQIIENYKEKLAKLPKT